MKFSVLENVCAAENVSAIAKPASVVVPLGSVNVPDNAPDEGGLTCNVPEVVLPKIAFPQFPPVPNTKEPFGN